MPLPTPTALPGEMVLAPATPPVTPVLEPPAPLPGIAKVEATTPVQPACKHDDQACLVARIQPSGRMALVCSKSGVVLRHLGNRVYIQKASFDPRDPVKCRAEFKVHLDVPLECDSADAFEMHGGYLDLSGCNCPADEAVDDKQARTPKKS